LKDLNGNDTLEKQDKNDAALLLICYLAFALFGYLITKTLGF